METVQASAYQSQKEEIRDTETSQQPYLRSQKRVKEVRPVQKKQIEDLNDRVKHELTRNKRTYQKLLSINPYFTMKLYCPINNFKAQEYNTEAITIMISQLELLLDDGRALEKQIMKSQLQKMQNQHRSNYGNEWRHHYAYLRRIWLNINESQSDRALDMIDQLNKKVVLIKNNLFSTIQVEKQQYSKVVTDQYENVEKKIGQMVQYIDEYEKLKEKYEGTKMAYEEVYQYLIDQNDEMKKKVGERNQVIRQIKSDNEELKRANKNLKQKLLTCEKREAQFLEKLKQNNLDFKPRELQKEVLRLQSPTKHQNQLLNFDTIKFQKNVNNDLVRSAKDLQTPTVEDIKVDSTKGKDLSLTEYPETKRQSEENYNYLNNERRMSISDTKSIDGKKTRFTRMRSPVGGKLMKRKGEGEGEERALQVQSPGLKGYKERLSQE